MKNRGKTSFASSFTMISLLLILSVKLILSLIFFNYLRSVVMDLTELNTKENIAHSRELIISGIEEHELALKQTAISLVYFSKQDLFSAETISGFLNDINKNLPNSLDFYFTNNNVWNQPGGFAAFGGGWIPDNSWDNTTRPWFTDAKNAKGKIAFSEPYVDSDTGNIIVTLSMSVFDGTNDIGVIAEDVTVNILSEIINMERLFEGQETFIVNADGLFITHDDISAVMSKNFFTEKNLEQYRASVLNQPETFIIDKNNFIYSSVIPHTSWILLTKIPTSEIFAKTNAFIMYLVVFTVVMFVCVTIITVLFTHRKITIPLADVKKVTDSLAMKNYNVNITSFRNDEIGDIQHALLKIRDSLKSGIDSLQDHIAKTD